MTKQDKIELLLKFIKGEVPAEKLTRHKVVFFMYMTPQQQKEIEDITGPATYHNSEYMTEGEKVRGLFDGIPVGFTAIWHLSMLWYPDSEPEIIAGTRLEVYNPFIERLRNLKEA